MRRHFKARHPALNVHRLSEVVSTDPIFSNCKAIGDGSIGAQVFYGLSSKCIDLFGFKRKSEFPRCYKDFIRNNGAPSALRRDNAKEEQSEEIGGIQRQYLIKDQFSEPHNQQQNPVESGAIRWIKSMVHVLLDHTGAPDVLWLLAAAYLAYVWNRTWHPQLNMTPYQFRHGVPPDISPLLQFTFFQKVLYLDHEHSWPSTRERAGRWVGIAENIGDAMTYWILDEQSKQVLARSVVRPFENNYRVQWDSAFLKSLKTKHTAQHGGEKWHPSVDTSLEDEYDMAEPVPGQHPICVTQSVATPKPNAQLMVLLQSSLKNPTSKPSSPPKTVVIDDTPVNEGFDLDGKEPFVEQSKEGDPYKGPSQLRFAREKIPMSEEIPTFEPSKMESQPLTWNSVFSTPLHKKAKAENQLLDASIKDEPPDPHEEPTRKSPRLHGTGETNPEQGPRKGEVKMDQAPALEEKPKLRRSPRFTSLVASDFSRFRKCFSLLLMGACVLPTHAHFEPQATALEPPMQEDLPQVHMIPIGDLTHDTSVKTEKLRAYHAALDRWNLLVNPQAEDHFWIMTKISRHSNREHTDIDGNKRRSIFFKTTFADGFQTWIDKDTLRLEDPYLVIDYATRKELTSSAGFEWIDSYLATDEEHSNVLRSFKTKVQDGQGKVYKFGVEVPRNPKHALELDKENGTTGWKDSIKKELDEIMSYSTFRVLPDGAPTPKGYVRIPYHMVHDVKFDGRLKSRLVAGGHRSPHVDKEERYASVVSLESIRLGFAMAKLNGLSVCAGDIGNACLNASCETEKLFIIAGPEFGPELEGKRLIIERALYGLYTSARRFHMLTTMFFRHLGFEPSKADSDLLIKEHEDGHYEYIARYVDDVMIFSKDPMSIMRKLEEHFTMKGIGKPRYYLGGDVMDLDESWEKEGLTQAFSAETYINELLPKTAKMLGIEQFHKANSPHDQNYHPELDTSAFLDAEGISKFRSMLGSLNWVNTLGRFDIAYALNAMSRYSMAPRLGHLEAMKRIFGYLRQFPNGQIIIDNGPAPIRNKAIINDGHDWSELYPDVEEDKPDNAPVAKGNLATLTCYVDADHARDRLTRRSVSGIVLLMNNTPMVAISKRQKTVECSTYGSEMIAARIAVELLIEWRYKLTMLGLKVEDKSWLVGDNMAVILSTTLPSSNLKKKHLACNYHKIREAVSSFLVFGHIDTKHNVADICTKPLDNSTFSNLARLYLFRKPKCLEQARKKEE